MTFQSRGSTSASGPLASSSSSSSRKPSSTAGAGAGAADVSRRACDSRSNFAAAAVAAAAVVGVSRREATATSRCAPFRWRAIRSTDAFRSLSVTEIVGDSEPVPTAAPPASPVLAPVLGPLPGALALPVAATVGPCWCFIQVKIKKGVISRNKRSNGAIEMLKTLLQKEGGGSYDSRSKAT